MKINKPTHERLREIHLELSSLRSEIEDFYFKDKLWKDRLEHCSRGISCVMIALYDAQQDIENHYEKWIAPKF